MTFNHSFILFGKFADFTIGLDLKCLIKLTVFMINSEYMILI